MELFFMIVLLLVFLAGSTYNLANLKKIKVRVYIPTHIKLIMILSVIVLIYIAYITRNDFLAYLTASLGSILFISGQYCKGVYEEAIYAKVHLLRVTNLFIPKILFEELDKIRFDEKEDYLIFRANRGTEWIDERFDLEKKELLESYVQEYKK